MALSQTAVDIINKNASLSHAYIYGYSIDGRPITSKLEAKDLSQSFPSSLLLDQPIPSGLTGFAMAQWQAAHLINENGIVISNNQKSSFLKGEDGDMSFVAKTTKEHSLITTLKIAQQEMNDFKQIKKQDIQDAQLYIKEINDLNQELKSLISNNATIKEISDKINDISIKQKDLFDGYINYPANVPQYQKDAMKLLIMDEYNKSGINIGDIDFDWISTKQFLDNLNQNTPENLSKNINDVIIPNNEYEMVFNEITTNKIDNNDKMQKVHDDIYHRLFEKQMSGQINLLSLKNIGIDDDYKLAFQDDVFLKQCIKNMPNLLTTNHTEDEYQKVAIDLNSHILNKVYLAYDHLPENCLRNALMMGDQDIKILNHIENSPEKTKEIKKCYEILFEKADIFEKALDKALKDPNYPEDKIQEIKDELSDIYTNQIHKLTSELCNNNTKNLNKNQNGITYQQQVAECLHEFLNKVPKIHGSALSQMIHALPLSELDKQQTYGMDKKSISEIILDRFDIANLDKNKLTVDDADLLQGLLAHKDFDFENPKHYINNQPIHKYLEDNKQDFLLYIEAQKSPQAVKVYKETKNILAQLNNEHGHNDLSMRLESTYIKQKASLISSIQDYKQNFSSYSIETKVYLGALIALETAMFAMAGIAKFFVGSVAKVKDMDGLDKKTPYKMIQNKETGEFEVFIKLEDPVHKGILVETKVGIFDTKDNAFKADLKVLDGIQNSFNNDNKKLLDEFIASTNSDAQKDSNGQVVIAGKPQQTTGARQTQKKGRNQDNEERS